jgi:predicted transcriptional regulator
MKKTIIVFLTAICFIFISELHASNDRLEVGEKVPAWLLKGLEKDYRLNSWPNRLVIINYVDPRFDEQGTEMVDALIEAVKSGMLSLEIYQPVVVVNCETTWYPNFILRSAAKSRVEKCPELKPLLLFDYEGDIDKRWVNRNKKDASCFIVIGKDGVCRAIYRGKMSKDQIDELIALAVDIQNDSGNFLENWLKKILPE